MFHRILTSALVGSVISLCASGSTQIVQAPPRADKIQPLAMALSADWRSHLPPSGSVNLPEILPSVYPGQRIALGIVAIGDHRHELLKKLWLHVTFSSQDGRQTEDLQPAEVRDIKADGADFAITALMAGATAKSDLDHLRQVTSLTTMAIFEPNWIVPHAASEVTIDVALDGTAAPVLIAPVTLRVRPDSDWLKEGPTDRQTWDRFMARFHGGIAPGRIVQMFNSACHDGALNAAPVEAYFVFMFKTNADARAAAVRLHPTLDAAAQYALARTLRRAGQDTSDFSLTATQLASLKTFVALDDPPHMPDFSDAKAMEAMRSMGSKMDQCWGAWMATGDVKYLQTLVQLLNNASDFSALEAWQQAHGGREGLNAKVARGLAYQIAGWSIGSFQRTDPLVSDWLLYWQQDPNTSDTVRREIASLPTNPAFRRK